MAESWSNCSVDCGVGIKTRRVYCFNHLTNTTSEYCEPKYKPSDIDNCFIKEEDCAKTTTKHPSGN